MIYLHGGPCDGKTFDREPCGSAHETVTRAAENFRLHGVKTLVHHTYEWTELSDDFKDGHAKYSYSEIFCCDEHGSVLCHPNGKRLRPIRKVV